MYLYTAIIIEPRCHPAFELVLRNYINNLDNRWRIIIFHGILNKDYILNIIKNNYIYENRKRIKLIKLNIKNLSINEYSMILMHENIYKYIPTEIFLIFQTDTLISEKYKNIIYDFIKYDYVGAPWRNGNIGNGGLSLRRKSKMIEIIRNKKNKFRLPNIYYNEDDYFSYYNNIYKPNFNKARYFSIELVNNKYSFGIHKTWEHLNKNEIYKISKYIPEIYLLIYYNNILTTEKKDKEKSIEEIFNNIIIEYV